MAKPSKDERRKAQERLAEQRAAQAAADRRRSILLGTITVAVIALIAVGVGVVYTNQSNEAKDVGTVPQNTVTDADSPSVYGALTGVARSDKPIIDIYEDFQCPACKQFEDAMGPTLEELGESGDYTIVYHPMQFLDANLNNDSSARAASASGCAADRDLFLPFHNEVYKNQPEREGAGFTDQDLITFGNTAGITDADWEACVTEQRYAKWAKNGVQRNADDRSVTSTPSFFVAGQKLNGDDFFDSAQGGWQPEQFKAAVEAAAAQGS